MQSTQCLNCASLLLAGQRFCPQCGQKTDQQRLTLHEIGHQLLHYFTHADKGIFSLLQQLATRPGKTAREYVAGKRRSHFPPLNFFLIVAAIGLAVSGWSYSHRQQAKAPTQYSSQATPKVYHEKYARSAEVGAFFGKYYNVIPILATPIFTFIIWLCFYRSGYTYAEHLVANMYIVGFSLLVYAVLVMPLQFLLGSNALIIPYFVFECTYRALSYFYFINRRTLPAFLYSVVCNVALVAGWFWLTREAIRYYINHGF